MLIPNFHTRFLLPLALFGVFFLLPSTVYLQNNRVAEWLESMRPSGDFPEVELFQITDTRNNTLQYAVENATLLTPEKAVLKQITEARMPTLRLVVPNAAGDNFELELAQTSILAKGFIVGELSNKGTALNDAIQQGVFYRGIVKDVPGSIAAVSLFGDDVMIMISTPEGDYQVGKMDDGSDMYILYRSQDLKAGMPISCFTEELDEVPQNPEGEVTDRFIGCKVVQVYFECDYKLYTDKGSNTTNVVNYVTGLFNQVATLYANEDIDVDISEIYVWTTSDPYASLTSTSAILNAFRTTRGTNFNGDLAHLLTTRSVGGGIAYLDVLCYKSYAHAVSMIYNSYSTVPTYSWSVMVVTHELGHNIGSWHTQSCNWAGGAIDNCYTPEGSCSPGPAPVNGGTIMSYCHLTSNGINLNHGFGPLPKAHIQNRVLNASCLAQAGVVPTGLTTSNITSTSATLLWTAVPGALNYTVQYKLTTSSAWLTAGTISGTSYVLSNLSSANSYDWKVKTDCSGYSDVAQFSTLQGAGCNVPTGQTSSNVTSNSVALSWSAVSGATTYTVEYKTSASSTWIVAGTSTATTRNLTGLAGSTTYNWRVKTDCSGYSSTASFVTTASSCNKPTGLVTTALSSTSATVNWTAVSGAANYTVQYRPSSTNTYITVGTVTGTSFTLNGLNPATKYFWRVKANCSNYSNARTFTTPASLPAGEYGNLKLYPNPTTGTLFVQYEGPTDASTRIWVSDAAGRVVIQSNIAIIQDGLSVSALAPGMYLLHLKVEGEKEKVEKFVKM